MAAEGGDIIRHDYTYRGEEGEVIPEEATHITVEARKVRAEMRHSVSAATSSKLSVMRM